METPMKRLGLDGSDLFELEMVSTSPPGRLQIQAGEPLVAEPLLAEPLGGICSPFILAIFCTYI